MTTTEKKVRLFSNTTEFGKIQKALELLCKRAEQYTPKSDACYLVSRPMVGDEYEENFERDAELPDGFYCEDCIHEQIELLNNDFPDKEIDYEVDVDSTSFDNFQLCDTCGETISVSVLADEQELEHWACEDFAKILCEDRHFYELHYILSESNYDDTHKKLIKKIANKIIDYLTPKKAINNAK